MTQQRHLIKTSEMIKGNKVNRISPLWLGIGISGSLILVLVIVETVLGRWSEIMTGGEFDPLARVSTGVLRDVRIAIVHCLVIGYLPAALLHVMQNARKTVLALQGALDCTRTECEALAASVRLNPLGLAITGLIGLVLSFIIPYLVPPVPESPWNPSTWGPEVFWHRTLGPLTLVCGLWLGYSIVTVSIRMSGIAKRLCRIDLLDLSPLAPFTQLGLTNALLLIGFLSIWSLMMIETGFGQMMWIIGGSILVSTVLALLFPLQGVHIRIRHSKEKELALVNTKISKQWSSFLSKDSDRRSGDLADLLAYRSLVEGVPEWPFTGSTYARLFLYALLPAVTWGIGLIAEEVVGSFIH